MLLVFANHNVTWIAFNMVDEYVQDWLQRPCAKPDFMQLHALLHAQIVISDSAGRFIYVGATNLNTGG